MQNRSDVKRDEAEKNVQPKVSTATAIIVNEDRGGLKQTAVMKLLRNVTNFAQSDSKDSYRQLDDAAVSQLSQLIGF